MSAQLYTGLLSALDALHRLSARDSGEDFHFVLVAEEDITGQELAVSYDDVRLWVQVKLFEKLPDPSVTLQFNVTSYGVSDNYVHSFGKGTVAWAVGSVKRSREALGATGLVVSCQDFGVRRHNLATSLFGHGVVAGVSRRSLEPSEVASAGVAQGL